MEERDRGAVGARWRDRRGGWRVGRFEERGCGRSRIYTIRQELWDARSWVFIEMGFYYSVCFSEEFIAGLGTLTRTGAAMRIVLPK